MLDLLVRSLGHLNKTCISTHLFQVQLAGRRGEDSSLNHMGQRKVSSKNLSATAGETQGLKYTDVQIYTSDQRAIFTSSLFNQMARLSFHSWFREPTSALNSSQSLTHWHFPHLTKNHKFENCSPFYLSLSVEGIHYSSLNKEKMLLCLKKSG